jgi:RecQ-mediated genome instability protein 1
MALQTQVLAHFASKQLHLSPTYVASVLNAIHPNPTSCTPTVLTAVQNAFLQSALQQSAAPPSCLPIGLPAKHNITLPGPALVQVIHVQDIGLSRIAQLEALEKWANERGPRGLRVIDIPNEEDGEENGTANGDNEELSMGKSMCKVLLEDGKGDRVYGMEIKPIDEIKVGMPLGTKVFFIWHELTQVLLTNVPVLRGVLQLRPTNTTILGGKIEALNQGYFPDRWKQELEAELAEIKRSQQAQPP